MDIADFREAAARVSKDAVVSTKWAMEEAIKIAEALGEEQNQPMKIFLGLMMSRSKVIPLKV